MAYRTTDGAAAALTTPETFTLPHGRTITRAPRGVYWEPCLNGDCYVVYLVDSLGDRRGTGLRVPFGAPASVFDAAESEMREKLRRLDPPPLTLLR